MAPVASWYMSPSVSLISKRSHMSCCLIVNRLTLIAETQKGATNVSGQSIYYLMEKKKKRFSWKLKRYNPAAGKVSFSNLSAGLQKHVHRCCYQGRVLVMSSPTTLPHCPTALTYFGMGMITSSLLGIFRQREREKERERGPCFPPKSESALCVNPLALECMFACFHENWISKELIVDGNNTNYLFFKNVCLGLLSSGTLACFSFLPLVLQFWWAHCICWWKCLFTCTGMLMLTVWRCKHCGCTQLKR